MRRRRTPRRMWLILAVVTLWFGALLAQEGMLDSDAEVSEVVYPRVSTIRFPHSKHADVACTSCHSAAATSTRSNDDLSPTKAACTSCHSEQSPKMETCSECHVNYPIKAKPGQNYKDVRPAPMPRVPAATRIRFDHKKHVKMLTKEGAKDACTTCHGSKNGIPSMPAESTCTSCHTAQKAPNDCATCHVTDPKTRRVKTSFADSSKTLKPNNHTVDFMKRHGAVAQTNPDDCASCHTESQCMECHVEQRAKNFAVHPPNFLQIHSLSARSEQGKCGDCHNAQTFCFQCHVEAGAVTVGGDDPPPRLQYHPPGWLDASFASNHGVNARRNIVECASCHVENDCVTCHAGINPHPADFVFTCRKWLESNTKPCAKCHNNLEDLVPLCR